MKKYCFLIMTIFILYSCVNDQQILTKDDFIIVEKQISDFKNPISSYTELINSNRKLDIEYLSNYCKNSRYTVFNHCYPLIPGSDTNLFYELVAFLNSAENFNYLGIGIYNKKIESSAYFIKKNGGHAFGKKKETNFIYKTKSFTDKNTIRLIGNSPGRHPKYKFLGFLILDDLNINHRNPSKIKLDKDCLIHIETISFQELRDKPSIVKDKIVVIARSNKGFENLDSSGQFFFGEDAFSGAELLINSLFIIDSK